MPANNLAIQFSTCSSLSEKWSVPVHPPTNSGTFSSALDWFWSRLNELPPCWRGLAAGLHPITQNSAAIPRTHLNCLIYFYSIDLVIISSLQALKPPSLRVTLRHSIQGPLPGVRLRSGRTEQCLWRSPPQGPPPLHRSSCTLDCLCCYCLRVCTSLLTAPSLPTGGRVPSLPSHPSCLPLWSQFESLPLG